MGSKRLLVLSSGGTIGQVEAAGGGAMVVGIDGADLLRQLDDHPGPRVPLPSSSGSELALPKTNSEDTQTPLPSPRRYKINRCTLPSDPTASPMPIPCATADSNDASNENPLYELDVVHVAERSGVYLSWEVIWKVRTIVLASAKQECYLGFLFICGTDSLEEAAFALDLLLPPEDLGSKPLVITGAMKPRDILGYDGFSNLRDSIEVAASPESRNFGVLVVMNDDIHPARYVRKHDSQLMGSFRSHPGPVGQIRRGVPRFYYSQLPQIERYPFPASLAWSELEMKDKVLIWTVAVGMGSFTIPDDLLENLDGLVLSGMGTGTLPDSYIEHLSPRWTTRIPIVIVSRCTVGCGYDDFYYRGSKDKYVRRGFVLDDGFEELNPVQARAKLILELTWKKWKKASEVTRQPEEGQSKSTTTSSRDGARE